MPLGLEILRRCDCLRTLGYSGPAGESRPVRILWGSGRPRRLRGMRRACPCLRSTFEISCLGPVLDFCAPHELHNTP
eukprot:682836-Prorocentrum_minimum.AAC.1